MALTDDQITAKNFRDFYDTIFPYLSGAVHAGFTPVGTIINVIGTTAPANYLKCDGATYSITAYLPLATYIKNQFGSYNHFGGDGVTTFAVPTKAGGTDDIYCIAIRDLNVDYFQNYSEDEQVIGTWYDRKPLYQKVVMGNISSSTVWVDFDSTVDLKLVGGYLEQDIGSSMQRYPINSCRGDAPTREFIQATIQPYNRILINFGTSTLATNPKYVLIVNYTKTTDQPTP